MSTFSTTVTRRKRYTKGWWDAIKDKWIEKINVDWVDNTRLTLSRQFDIHRIKTIFKLIRDDLIYGQKEVFRTSMSTDGSKKIKYKKESTATGWNNDIELFRQAIRIGIVKVARDTDKVRVKKSWVKGFALVTIFLPVSLIVLKAALWNCHVILCLSFSLAHRFSPDRPAFFISMATIGNCRLSSRSGNRPSSRARSAGCRMHLSHAPSRTSRPLQNTTVTHTQEGTEKKYVA